MSFFLKNWAALYKGTTAEHAIEPAIASLGIPYRWQHPVWACGYFLDFALPHEQIAIEIDDPSHDTVEGKRKDKLRTAKLGKKGWRVLRCKNEEAIDDPYGTIDRLMAQAGLVFRTRRP